MENTGLYWHIHHDILAELTTEPIKNRIDYITHYKPAFEVEVRLRLMKPVVAVPQRLADIISSYYSALKAYQQAEDNYYSAANRMPSNVEMDTLSLVLVEKKSEYYTIVSQWNNAYIELEGELEVLHRSECPDCPWNGETIFPETHEVSA